MKAEGDLFEPGGLWRLPIGEAEVLLLRECPLPLTDQEVLRRLVVETSWREEKVTVWGKTHLQPRLIAWHGDSGKTYSYSGIKMNPLPWTPLLLGLKAEIERIANAPFNSVLLNYYRNGLDSMGQHSDDERELGPEPVIASLSVGQERTLIFRHKRDKAMKPIRLPLPSGSLLLMKGPTQTNWKHSIDKEPSASGPRINLTFRYIFV